MAGYVPIDISRNQLSLAAKELASDYAGLEVLPVCADYTSGFELPTPKRPFERKVVYFPGSTIGVDLKKDPDVLPRAYNDRHGVTAAFNLNLLERINRELNGDFELGSFEHYAFYNPKEGRVEMHLVSRGEQSVHLDNVTIPFARGESIWTENSYKFTLSEFQEMSAEVGLEVQQSWTDEQQWFSVQYLTNSGGSTL